MLVPVAIAGVCYVLIQFWLRRKGFSVLNGIILVAILAVVTAVAIPLAGIAGEHLTQTALGQNLHALRSQIAVYKEEHGGRVPVLYQGSLPQLIHTTNVLGDPGEPGPDYPYGPYLPDGIPINPITGSRRIAPCETVPPASASGEVGWLYHQQSGSIFPDVEGYVDP